MGETLRIHSAKLRTADLDLELIAQRTDGQTGACLAHLLNEAALLAARRRADAVRMEHLEEVLNNPRPQQQRAQPTAGGEAWDQAVATPPEWLAAALAAAFSARPGGMRPAPVFTTS